MDAIWFDGKQIVPASFIDFLAVIIHLVAHLFLWICNDINLICNWNPNRCENSLCNYAAKCRTIVMDMVHLCFYVGLLSRVVREKETF